MYEGSDSSGNRITTIYGNTSVTPLEYNAQSSAVYITLSTCCDKRLFLGNWTIQYTSQQTDSESPGQYIVSFWNGSRMLSIIIIIVVGAVIVLIIVAIVIWRLCARRKKSDDKWSELEQVKKSRVDEEYKTASRKKLEECLSKPVDLESTTTPTNQRHSTSLQYVFVQQDDLKDEDIVPRSPFETPVASQTIFLDEFEKSPQEVTLSSGSIPSTPIETPRETPMTTPSSSIRWKKTDAITYVDDVLEDIS